MTDTMPPPQQLRRRGCLFYGCGTAIVLLLVVTLMGYLGYRKLVGFMDEFASREPMPLPPVSFTELQKDQMRSRLRSFADALREGKTPVPLKLSGDDLNLLIASSEEFKALGEHVRLRIEDGEVRAQLSIRFGDLGAPLFRERYLNGEGSFSVGMKNGQLVVSPGSLVVNGKPLPEKYLEAMRQENLAQAVNEDPDASATLEQLESIQIEGSTLTVVPR